jgi:regulatory protein YycI of two-component signal transduction system YycFG
VEKEGELTEAAIQSVIFRGKPYGLTEDLEELRAQLQQNPEGLESLAMRAKQKEQALNYINSKLGFICWEKTVCEEREKKEEEARQAAAVLPSLEVLDKILRYETKLERQLFRAMAQLERLQRMRRGESVPAPLSVELSERV